MAIFKVDFQNFVGRAMHFFYKIISVLPIPVSNL